MNSAFDVPRWLATFEPDEPAVTHSNNDPKGVPNRPWRKYLRWTLLCLALVVLGIYLADTLQRFEVQRSQVQRFQAQQCQDFTNVSIDTGNKIRDEIDVTYVTECLWILSSASSINSFPLLLSVNEKRHRGVLDELFTGTLDRLAQTQTEVSLVLKDQAQNVINQIAQAAKVFTLSEHDTVAFQSDINLAYKQLQEMDSLLDPLAKIYYGVKAAYDTVNTTTTSALEEVKLTNKTEFFSFAQSWGSSWFFNPYSVPWNTMSKKIDEVRLGFIALDKEVTRLEQIKQVIHWLKNTLQELSTSIHGWHTECTREVQHNCFPKKVREWFQQNFVDNHQLKETWLELIMSVEREEQKINLEISNEWCNRSRQASVSINSG